MENANTHTHKNNKNVSIYIYWSSTPPLLLGGVVGFIHNIGYIFVNVRYILPSLIDRKKYAFIWKLETEI